MRMSISRLIACSCTRPAPLPLRLSALRRPPPVLFALSSPSASCSRNPKDVGWVVAAAHHWRRHSASHLHTSCRAQLPSRRIRSDRTPLLFALCCSSSLADHPLRPSPTAALFHYSPLLLLISLFPSFSALRHFSASSLPSVSSPRPHCNSTAASLLPGCIAPACTLHTRLTASCADAARSTFRRQDRGRACIILVSRSINKNEIAFKNLSLCSAGARAS